MARPFTFESHWRLPAPRERVWRALLDIDRIGEWWPDFRQVRVVDRGRTDGLDRTIDVAVRGPIGVALRLRLRIVDALAPSRIVVAASGDLEGHGTFELTATDRGTDLCFVWDVSLRRPVLALVAPLLGPVYRASHDAVMRHGERGLNRHLRDTRDRGDRAAAAPRR